MCPKDFLNDSKTAKIGAKKWKVVFHTGKSYTGVASKSWC